MPTRSLFSMHKIGRSELPNNQSPLPRPEWPIEPMFQSSHVSGGHLCETPMPPLSLLALQITSECLAQGDFSLWPFGCTKSDSLQLLTPTHSLCRWGQLCAICVFDPLRLAVPSIPESPGRGSGASRGGCAQRGQRTGPGRRARWGGTEAAPLRQAASRVKCG